MTPGRDPAVIAWCDDPGIAGEIARLFVAHAEPSYISHSELQIGRAIDARTWAPDLAERVHRFANRCASTPDGAEGAIRLATLSRGGKLIGFAFVAFALSAEVPYATVEDLLVVPDQRSTGAGTDLMGWIADQCRSRGVRRLFLESGAGNHRAHAFFAREGFRQTSIVMMRDL